MYSKKLVRVFNSNQFYIVCQAWH